jgi:predicted oxidoreductase
MMEPIAASPFYAVELAPSMLNTQGGPRRNERGQIVRPNGKPIARLYSAGELGSIYSYLYQGTGNIGECLPNTFSLQTRARARAKNRQFSSVFRESLQERIRGMRNP